MKSILALYICTCLSINMFAQKSISTHAPEVTTEKVGAKMKFEKRHFDLGQVKKGEKKTMVYKFTNDGDEAIEIELVTACECTTLDWPRKAIQPGDSGEIEAIFDSSKKEESETVEVDVNLKNKDPKTGYSIFEIVSFEFVLIE